MKTERCLYFAFGSNLSLGQMRMRCPSAQVEARAVLYGYRLAFVGRSRLWGGGAVATLLHEAGARARGLLYSLTPEDLHALDGFEGHPQHYQRRKMRVVDEAGYTRRAWVYFLDGEEGLPAPAYFWRIADAYQAQGWPAKELEEALPQAVAVPEAPSLQPVFVYGTLRRGEGNHRLLAHSPYSDNTSLSGNWRMVSLGGFPGVVRDENVAGVIVGELYFVDEATLERLDRLEGHPHFYRRETVVLACGRKAWMYIFPEAGDHPTIQAGDWRCRSSSCVSS